MREFYAGVSTSSKLGVSLVTELRYSANPARPRVARQRLRANGSRHADRALEGHWKLELIGSVRIVDQAWSLVVPRKHAYADFLGIVTNARGAPSSKLAFEGLQKGLCTPLKDWANECNLFRGEPNGLSLGVQS
jgi:hypothetical protein